MFDKTKARIEKLEETNETFRKVSYHLKDNKKVYLAGAGCICVGFVGGKYLQRPIVIDFQPVIDIKNMPVFNNHNIGNAVENNLGRVSKIVRDTTTGKEWQKMRYLAEEIAAEHGISYDSARVRLSQHLRGLSDHVFNKKYEYAGLRTEFMN